MALRIREEGLTVLGFGEQKTPEAFRNACHKFVLTEILRPISTEKPELKSTTEESVGERFPIESPQSQNANTNSQAEEFPRQFVLQALEQASDDSGWANLGAFGSYLTKLQPDFDPRNFGYKKLSELVTKKNGYFLCREKEDAELEWIRCYMSELSSFCRM